MKTLDCAAFKAMFRAAAERIEESRAELTELDSRIGDGDHGTTMAKVMELVVLTADSCQGADVKGMFAKIGMAILSVGGGATVPLFGSLFGGMGRAVPEGTTEVDAAMLSAMFESGTQRLLRFSQASLGDKTLVDALLPAVDAMKAEAAGGDAAAILRAAAKAAAEGSEKTKEYIAKHGRAKNLGERAIGIPDPGSVSVSLIFAAFADAAKGV